MKYKLLLILGLLFSPFVSMANDLSLLEETMYSSGRINVVVGVIVLILLGLFFYLFKLDKKVKQLEKEISESK